MVLEQSLAKQEKGLQATGGIGANRRQSFVWNVGVFRPAQRVFRVEMRAACELIIDQFRPTLGINDDILGDQIAVGPASASGRVAQFIAHPGKDTIAQESDIEHIKDRAGLHEGKELLQFPLSRDHSGRA